LILEEKMKRKMKYTSLRIDADTRKWLLLENRKTGIPMWLLLKRAVEYYRKYRNDKTN